LFSKQEYIRKQILLVIFLISIVFHIIGEKKKIRRRKKIIGEKKKDYRREEKFKNYRREELIRELT
jgi:hypothetical protein